jgi:hypothetical protein
VSDQDQPAPGEHDPAYDDPAYDEVRGLLADARVTEPVPAEVAARLDATLSALRDQRRTDADRPSVRSLRSRRVGRILAAAAAVVLIGAGGVSLVRSAGNGSSSTDTAASGAAADQEATSHAGSDSGSGGAEKSVPAPLQPQAGTLDSLGTTGLRSAHFAHDAAVTMRALAPDLVAAEKARTPASGEATLPSDVATPTRTPASAGADEPMSGGAALMAPPVTATPRTDAYGTLDTASACAGPVIADAVTLQARLDGAPVALVFHTPSATEQLVEAWSCDGTRLLASASVPH